MITPQPPEADNSEQHSLPFSLDKEAFSIWLERQDKKDKLEVLQVFLGILKTLTNTKIKPDIRAFILEELSALVFQFSEQLQASYRKSYFPFSAEDTFKVEVSSKCTIEIAENYALICKDIGFKTKIIFSPAEKALILVNAIQAMVNVMLYKALLYKKLGKGFWSLCYLFYLFAQQNEVMELAPDQRDTCFIKVFKQLLVFELSNTQQFNTEEIHLIFDLLSSVADKVDLLPMVPEKKVNSVPSLNLRVGAPPAVSKEVIPQSSPYLYYVSNLNLIKQLFELSADKRNTAYNNRIMLLRLIKALTMNQHRKNDRELADNELYAEIGLDKFSEFLMHKESILKTKGVVSYEVRDLSITDDFKQESHDERFGYRNEVDARLSLLKGPGEEKVEYFESADIWSAENTEPEAQPNIKVIDQSHLGFCLRLLEQHPDTKVGDIIHLKVLPTDVVTVVRRINTTRSNEVIVGVEVLGYDPELLHIMDIDNEGAKTACILVDIDGQETIIIKSDVFTDQEYLVVDRNDKILRYRVENILNSSTSIIKHLEVKLA